MKSSPFALALLSTSMLYGCVAADFEDADLADTEPVEIPPAAFIGPGSGPECSAALCGPNGPSMTNGVVDEIDFTRATRPGGYEFVSWRKGRDGIQPVLGSRGIFGKIGSDVRSRYGAALVDSIIRLEKGDDILLIRFDAAESPAVPVGNSVVAYRLSYRTYDGRWSSWSPLCERFRFKDDPNDTYEMVLFGTQERFRPPVPDRTIYTPWGPILLPGRRAQVVPSEPSSGIATLGCPVTVPGKMLGLGMTPTTMKREHLYEIDLDYSNAALHAYRLAPEGMKSYTPEERQIFIAFDDRLLDNKSDELPGYPEGYWDENGAICFERLRVRPDETARDLYREAGTPACDEVPGATARALVRSFLPFGTHDPGGLVYPPEDGDDGPIMRDPVFQRP